MLNKFDAIRLCRFRTTNPYLPIETGRWRNIDRGNTYCILCNCRKLGDEYCYVLECYSFNKKSKQLLPKYVMKRYNVSFFFKLMSAKCNCYYKKYVYLSNISRK